jgi:hypothetical protein
MEPTVRTDGTIANNKPDIIRRYNNQGIYMSIDVEIPADRNVNKKQAKKILKQKNLTTNSAHVDCESKSDTGNNRATGFRQYLSNLPGKGKVKELQTTAILGTAHCGKC